ncbi:Bug family tripartite tricarboxylate transporter substrate binding protein [Roseomonas xinghualingensis]|uniref:Bug family tripartite tricarboxylate transporter substrate binding protein n=1 Tax=Roseomonas xinghualingensis TaxID=2986475 RepID=UPI0021F1DDB7|nr:tripartite tricarboxylate transporter substrate binding protein [Roseomonas sp. SXEYE001]MCV4207208.1 tripartite tricarboxylate transporter substrate binding protein [Roseomonas sp. SXEYE001]
MQRRNFLRSTSGLALAGTFAMPSVVRAADPFPSRPVTMVVPFPPGGATDVAARTIAERMAPLLGQPVIIDNKPGAQTSIGADAVARAHPDGHTVLMASGTTMTLNPLLPDKLPYKAEDFAPIVLVTTLPFGVVVRKGLAHDIPSFVALAKSRNGQLNYGSNGPTSFNNLAAVVVMEGLGIKMQEIGYRGDAQQLTDLMAGTLDVIVVGGSSALGAQRSGRGTIVGWTGENERLSVTPDVPNFSELGPNMVCQTHFGLLAPARTPPAAITRLNQAALKAMEAPELRERLLSEGQYVRGGSPADYSTYLRRDADRWRELLAKLARA